MQRGSAASREPGYARAKQMREGIRRNLERQYMPRNWGGRTRDALRRLVGGEGRPLVQVLPRSDWQEVGEED